MNKYTEKFHQTLQGEDFITAWEEELHLRRQLRSAEINPEQLSLEDEEDFFFLKRSLYYGPHRDDFFRILLYFLNSQPVIQGLNQSSSLKTEFFSFLSCELKDYPADAAEIQGLINLYNDDFIDSFAQIINTLDEPSCTFLMKRSGNPRLRELLQHQIKDLQNKEDEKPCQEESSSFSRRLLQASEALDRYLKSFNPTTGLETAEALFEAGMIEDCLVVLKLLSAHLAPNQDSSEGICWQKLINKVLPLYAMLKQPFYARESACWLMQNHFPIAVLDSSELDLLKDYSQLMQALLSEDKEQSIMLLENWQSSLPEEKLPLTNPALYLDESLSIVPGAPHRALFYLERFRLFLRRQAIQCSVQDLKRWASGYLLLYKRFGHQLFLNADILPFIDPSSLPDGKQNEIMTLGKIREKLGVFR